MTTYVRVAGVVEARDLVDVAVVGEVEDRILLAVGIKVADDDHVGVARAGLQRSDGAAQRVCLLGAQGVPAALPVILVCVGAAVVRAAALGLG